MQAFKTLKTALPGIAHKTHIHMKGQCAHVADMFVNYQGQLGQNADVLQQSTSMYCTARLSTRIGKGLVSLEKCVGKLGEHDPINMMYVQLLAHIYTYTYSVP